MSSLDKDSKKHRKTIRELHHKADPAASSRVLNPREHLREAEPNVTGRQVLGNVPGERFHHIPPFKFPRRQQFFSRLLKPFLPVADVVERDGAWYSYQPHVENIEATANPSIDNLLVTFLTGDLDRSLYNSIRKDGKAIYYDFEEANLFPSIKFTDVVDELWELGAKVIPYAAGKTENMLAYWQSPEGRAQVEAAFRDASEELGEELKKGPKGEQTTFYDFYEILLARVTKLNTAVHKMLERASERSS